MKTKYPLMVFRDHHTTADPVNLGMPQGYPPEQDKLLQAQLPMLHRQENPTPSTLVAAIPAGRVVNDVVFHDTYDRVSCTIDGHQVTTVRWALTG